MVCFERDLFRRAIYREVCGGDVPDDEEVMCVGGTALKGWPGLYHHCRGFAAIRNGGRRVEVEVGEEEEMHEEELRAQEVAHEYTCAIIESIVGRDAILREAEKREANAAPKMRGREAVGEAPAASERREGDGRDSAKGERWARGGGSVGSVRGRDRGRGKG